MLVSDGVSFLLKDCIKLSLAIDGVVRCCELSPSFCENPFLRKINQLMMEKLDKYAFYMQAKH